MFGDKRAPADDASELDWLVFRQEGVLARRQAVELVGVGRTRHLLASGRWRSICRGVLVTHTGPLTSDAQLWAAVLAAGPGAVVAGLSAAIEAGLRGFRRENIHLLVPDRRGYPDLLRRMPGEMPAVLVRRTRVLPRSELRGRPLRTGTARALVDAAQLARSDNEARTIVAAGCQQRLVDPDDILRVAAALPRARRRRLTIETARDAKGGAEALSEVDLLRLCRRHRLPRPDLQERRTDVSGRTRYLDGYWREWRLHVEVDGSHHMDARHWEADLVRQNEVWLAGDRILRFSAWQVRHRAAYVAAQIRAALLAAGWQA